MHSTLQSTCVTVSRHASNCVTYRLTTWSKHATFLHLLCTHVPTYVPMCVSTCMHAHTMWHEKIFYRAWTVSRLVCGRVQVNLKMVMDPLQLVVTVTDGLFQADDQRTLAVVASLAEGLTWDEACYSAIWTNN